MRTLLGIILFKNIQNQLRVTENHDVVVVAILLCICLYLVMIFSLRGERNIKEFFVSNIEETRNVTLSWLITSFCFVLLVSTFLADYIPYVPSFVKENAISGYTLNRFGFTFLSVFAFYVLKTIFSYLYYYAIGNGENWTKLTFYATKYYFVISILIMIMNFAYYFYPIDKLIFFYIFLIFSGIAFVFKLLFYRFHQGNFMPNTWYYKFLYICTLQIAPILALWKLLFY